MKSLEDLDIYLLPIGGTGMASLAGLLQAAGARVIGSDRPLYPPTSILLEDLGIEVLSGFTPGNLDRPIDRVVIGNAVPRHNEEVVAVLERGLDYTSMPEAVHDYFLKDRHPMVVTGTHGKTTTSSLLAWILESANRQPSFLIGGQLQNFGQNFQLGSGPCFVIEGDEYNTAFFDRGPKFHHYAARTLLINNVELDHVDVYPDFDAVLTAFRAAVARVPEGGLVVYNADDEGARKAIQTDTAAETVGFSLTDRTDAAWRGQELATTPGAMTVEIDSPAGRFEADLPADSLSGRHNFANALGAAAMAHHVGLNAAEISQGLAGFRGVRRRLEVIAEIAGVTIVDDFAHHATAIRETTLAAQRRWPGRRIWAIFEPRSLSAARRQFTEDYRRALATPDIAVVAPAFHSGRIEEGDRIDFNALAADLSRGGHPTRTARDVDQIVAIVRAGAREGDVLLCMSSGSFGGLPGHLAASLS